MSSDIEAGLIDGKLRACPDSPNCVCSEFTSSSHEIKPFVITGETGEAWVRLLDIVQAQAGTSIVDRNENYVRARVRTALLRFEDILEFRLDESTQQIQVRSASRLGYWDLGVNRRRVEAIREQWAHH